jgi:uncharacterized protein (TIGR03437 family)
MRRILATRLFSGSVILAFLLAAALQAQPQIGGGVCTNSTLNGIYYYFLSRDLLSGNAVYPYVELGKLVANGQGGLSGNSHASIGGSISAYTLSGTYSIQSSCAGTMSLSVNSGAASPITFQVTNGGQSAVVAFSSSSGVVAGRAYRQTAATGTIQCSTASLSGGYAYLLTGVAFISGNGYYYSQAGSATGDGLGNMTVAGMANVNGTTLTTTGQGPYSVASDCTGTASVKNQSGTANYFIAVAQDGQVVLFMESDSGYSVGGVADPIFVTPQSAAVNAASFDAGALSPGGIFTVFGKGLQQSASSGQVLVNGEAAPVFFANGSQINAQIPYDVPTNQPVSLSLLSSGAPSNTALVSLQQAAPGIFTSPGNRAVVENADYSVNSPSNPTHVGDFVTVYLTGGGSVSPTVTTGVPAPLLPLSYVNGANSVSIGGLTAFVYFLGLTPGFEGLYQANVQVPVLAPGDYPVVATVGGVASNGPLISVR